MSSYCYHFVRPTPIPQAFFFSTHLFDRRMFSSKDSFAGQSPGIGHDASHLYTGGKRMCKGESQVQARLLRRGLKSGAVGGELVASARISLMEGVLPSRSWQPDRSWSRRDAAKARMAACVSMALKRWTRALVREWRRRAGSWRAFVWRTTFGKLRLHHSNVLELQSLRQQGDIADPGGIRGRCVPCSSSRPLELCPTFVGARLV